MRRLAGNSMPAPFSGTSRTPRDSSPILGEVVEDPGTQRIRVGEAELVDDGQGPGPRGLGGDGVVSGVLGHAEVDESGGFAVAVPAAVEQVDSPLVGVDGLLVLTELVVDVAEAVLDVGLAVEIADLQSEGESPPAVHESLAVVADLRAAPAEVVECGGLPRQVMDRLVVLEAAPGVVTCLPVKPVGRAHPGQVLVGAGLAGVVVQ